MGEEDLGTKVKALKKLLRVWEMEEVEARQLLPNVQSPTGTIDQYGRQATDTWHRIADDCKLVRKLLKEVGDNDNKGMVGRIRSITQDNSRLLRPRWQLNLCSNHSCEARNISFMFYSFLFSVMGFACSVGIHIPLSWYCRGPNIRIKYPQILEGFIALIGVGGAISVALAFVLLGACIQTMNRNPTAPPQETFSPLPAAILEYLVVAGLCLGGAVLFIIFMIWRLFCDPRVPERGGNRRFCCAI